MTKEQLGQLILSSERQLYATAKSILMNDQDCADAIQEAIVKAFSKIHSLKNDKYAKTWLMRILINECYTIGRQMGRIEAMEDENMESFAQEETPDYSELYRAVNKLKEELKLPVILYYMEEFSVKEIAQILDISEGAVQKRLVYAGTKMYNLYLEHKAQYSVATGISGDDCAKKIKLPKEIHDIEITAGYIPEGMEWMNKNRLRYADTPYQGGISISSVLMDKDDLGKTWIDKGVIESEELDFGDHDAVYVKYLDLKQDKSFDSKIYLLCPEEYRVFTIYFGDDVTKEDAVKFVENMFITEKDEMIETKGLLTWSDLVNPVTKNFKVENEIAEDKITITNIGNSMPIETIYENATGNTDMAEGISVCVDDVQIFDDLSIFGDNSIPEEWKDAVSDDGKLKPNNLSYVKAGDGETTLDKVVNEASVNQKLVYVNVTYTNNTDSELKYILYLGYLVTMKHENSAYRIYAPAEEPGAGYDYYMGDGVARIAEMTYSSAHEDYGNGGNYIASLQPGESTQIAMAWIVNENDLGNMYLSLNPDSGAYEFSDSMLKAGMVYIGR